MTNSEDYEESLNDCVKSYRNAVKDNKAEIPQGFGMAFNYGYTFGLHQAKSEQKENVERQQNFRREHIAVAAMQGLLGSSVWMKAIIQESNPDESGADDTDVMPLIASKAVAIADALINELNKTKQYEHND